MLILVPKAIQFMAIAGPVIDPLGRVRAIKPQSCGPQSR